MGSINLERQPDGLYIAVSSKNTYYVYRRHMAASLKLPAEGCRTNRWIVAVKPKRKRKAVLTYSNLKNMAVVVAAISDHSKEVVTLRQGRMGRGRHLIKDEPMTEKVQLIFTKTDFARLEKARSEFNSAGEQRQPDQKALSRNMFIQNCLEEYLGE